MRSAIISPLIALALSSLIATGCTHNSSSTPDDPARVQQQQITQLTIDIKNETGIAVEDTSDFYKEHLPSVVLLLTEFQNARHTKKMDVSKYKKIKFVVFDKNAVATEESADDPTELTLTLGRSKDAIQHSFQYLPNNQAGLPDENDALKAELEQLLAIKIEASDSAGVLDNVAYNWTLKLLKAYANESAENKALLKRNVSFRISNFTETHSQDMNIDGATMDATALRTEINASANILDRFEAAKVRLNRVGKITGLRVELAGWSNANIDVTEDVAASLEHEMYRPDNGLQRAQTLYLSSVDRILVGSDQKPHSIMLRISKYDDEPRVDLLSLLRNNAPLVCDEVKVACK